MMALKARQEVSPLIPPASQVTIQAEAREAREASYALRHLQMTRPEIPSLSQNISEYKILLFHNKMPLVLEERVRNHVNINGVMYILISRHQLDKTP